MRFYSSLFSLALLAVAAVDAATPLRPVEIFRGDTSGRYIVKLKDGTSKSSLLAGIKSANVTHDWKVINGFAGQLFIDSSFWQGMQSSIWYPHYRQSGWCYPRSTSRLTRRWIHLWGWNHAYYDNTVGYHFIASLVKCTHCILPIQDWRTMGSCAYKLHCEAFQYIYGVRLAKINDPFCISHTSFCQVSNFFLYLRRFCWIWCWCIYCRYVCLPSPKSTLMLINTLDTGMFYKWHHEYDSRTDILHSQVFLPLM